MPLLREQCQVDDILSIILIGALSIILITLKNDFPGKFVEEIRETLPPQYNSDSLILLPEVKRSAENRFDFDLSSGSNCAKAKC